MRPSISFKMSSDAFQDEEAIGNKADIGIKVIGTREQT